MRATVSRRALIALGVALLLFMALLPPMMKALATERDTLLIGDKEGGRVKIRIDSHGISIEAQDEETGKKGSASVVIEERGRKKTSSDIVRFGDHVHIGPDEEVRGDVVIFGGTLVVEGKIRGDAVVMGGRLEARDGSEINGDAVVIGGKLEDDPGALIQGERVVIGFGFPVLRLGNVFAPFSGWVNFVFLPLKFVFYLLVVFIVVALMGARLVRTREPLVGEYWKSFGWGLLAAFIGCFALPVVLILLAITIIGIPFALLLVLACVVLFFVAIAVFTYDLGLRSADRLGTASKSPYLFCLLGLVVLFLPRFLGYGLSVIPFMWPFGLGLKILGSLFLLFGFIVGFGALITSRFGSHAIASVPEAPPPAEASPPAQPPDPSI